MTAAEKWLTMVLLCISGSVIFWLPFFSDIFYVPMQTTFGFSHTQIGTLISTFGITSLVGYFPGGWLADRYPPRRLITAGLLIVSAGGMVFSTIPSFAICVLLYGVWGLASAMVFWSAMIKAIRNWGSKEEQGRAFGILEGGRSITDAASAAILLALFALWGADDSALANNIVLQTTVPFALAIVVWLQMTDDVARSDVEPQSRIQAKDLKAVVRMPMVWLLAIIVMAGYSGYWGSVYLTPYATDIYALGDVFGGTIGVAKYAIAAVAAIVAGLVADKIGIAKAVVGAFTVMTAGFLIFALVPGAPHLVPLLLINGAVASCAIFALRGIYFALIEEGGIPVAVTGTVAGLVSIIGYTPDIFVPTIAGVVLDHYPGARGYQVFFTIIACVSFVGLIAAYFAYRRVQISPAINLADD